MSYANGEAVHTAVALLAYDAGLRQPHEMDAGSIRHTDILYFLRQGSRLGELARIIGSLPLKQLTADGSY